ncbi:hypothetical protein ACE6H2_010902 [Prunus campanulata]
MKSGETKKATRRGKNEKAIVKAETDWEFFEKIYATSGERNRNHMDSVDWEAVRQAEVGEIAHAIQDACDGFSSEVSLATTRDLGSVNIVYCTKRKPNCNSCPMRGECRHCATAFASARLALPRMEKKARPTKEDSSAAPPSLAFEALNSISLSFLEANRESEYQTKSCEPIIEEPPSPQPESTEIPDIEDLFLDDPNYIPTIKMRDENFSENLKRYMCVFRENDTSTELVASQNAYAPKLKHV